MTNPAERAAKRSRQFVEFRFGDKDDGYEYARYVNGTEDEPLFGDAYLSRLELEIQPWRRTGRVGDEEGDLELSLPLVDKSGNTDAFLDEISDGYPFSRVDVFLRTVIEDEEGVADPRTEFVGHVLKATRNHQGRRGVVGITCQTWKHKVEQALGIPADSRCPWGLGDKTCGVDLKARHEFGTITSIDSSTVTIAGLSTGAVYSGWYWKHGYISKRGARVFIRAWKDDAPTVFRLERDARPSWLGQQVRVVPGCKKTPDVCDDVYGNLPFFGGIGKKTPNENPVFKGKK